MNKKQYYILKFILNDLNQIYFIHTIEYKLIPYLTTDAILKHFWMVILLLIMILHYLILK